MPLLSRVIGQCGLLQVQMYESRKGFKTQRMLVMCLNTPVEEKASVNVCIQCDSILLLFPAKPNLLNSCNTSTNFTHLSSTHIHFYTQIYKVVKLGYLQ